MSCNCEGKTINIGMGCCEPVLAPIENYYTKYQIDKMLSGGTSGCCITPEEVDDKIESAKTEIESEIPSLSGYATEQWVEDQHYISGVDLSDYALKSEIPTSNSGLKNDAGYITSAQTESAINSATSGLAESSAVTASLAEKVNVVDNEVPPFSAETLVSYYGGFPSSAGSEYNYDTSKDYAIVPLVNGNLYRNYIKIVVVDSGGTKTSGETSGIRASLATIENVNPLPDYLTVESADTRTFKYTPNEGYRISHVSNRETYDGDPLGYGTVYVNGTLVTYAGGQSEYVIENTILPELAKKGNKVAEGNETITIIHDNTSGEDRIRVSTDYSVSSYYSGSTKVPTTKAVYNALQTKADTTYVQNNYMAKNQIWCGDYTEWAQISGSTQNDVLYLIHQ